MMCTDAGQPRATALSNVGSSPSFSSADTYLPKQQEYLSTPTGGARGRQQANGAPLAVKSNGSSFFSHSDATKRGYKWKETGALVLSGECVARTRECHPFFPLSF
jgi:hypothetical protein